MDKLREMLYKAIEEHGLSSIEALRISKLLDTPVAKEQKKRYEEYKNIERIVKCG